MANATPERANEAKEHYAVYIVFPGRDLIHVTDPLITDLLLNEKIDVSTAVRLHDRLTADAEAAREVLRGLQTREHDVMNLCGILGLDAEEQLEPRVRQMAKNEERLCLSVMTRGLLDVLAKLQPEELRALDFFLQGERPCYSTGIHGSLTAGYGRLDDYGFWQYPLPAVFVARAAQLVKDHDRANRLEDDLIAATTFLERVQLWADTDLATWTANMGCRVRVHNADGFRKRTADVTAALTQCREALAKART